jgi:hypothetical protein
MSRLVKELGKENVDFWGVGIVFGLQVGGVFNFLASCGEPVVRQSLAPAVVFNFSGGIPCVLFVESTLCQVSRLLQ